MKGDAGVLVFEPDLLFSSKIEGLTRRLGVEVSIVTDIGELVSGFTGNPPRLIILNLDGLEGRLVSLKDFLTRKSCVSVGYYSHKNRRLREEAEESGIAVIMSRGDFVSKLQDILVEALGG
jgi:hypothetical protein